MKNLSHWLHSLGVKKIFFGAGSRNSLLLDSLKEFEIELFFDERSLAFKALGFAKISSKPSVIVLTSGTAVTEVFSAVVEAEYSNTQLIVIGTDRPKRLTGTRAPQAIEQTGIFKNFAETIFDDELNAFPLDLPVSKLPVHINIRLDDRISTYKKEVNFEKQHFGAIFSTGGDAYLVEMKFLLEKRIPILVESVSHLEVDFSHPNILKEKEFSQLIDDKKINSIIKFGDTPITKIWRDLDRSISGVKCYSFKNKFSGMEECEIIYDLSIVDALDGKHEITNSKNEKLLCELVEKFPQSEVAVFYNLEKNTDKDVVFYLGNSMPIRYWELVWKGRHITYANRGVNGIDGQLATAIGIASGTKKEVYCILGDLTFLYDLNSLLFNIPSNLTVFIINNQGGRIFERVPVNHQMILEHQIDIEGILNGFGDISSQFKVLNVSNSETNQFWRQWNEK